MIYSVKIVVDENDLDFWNWMLQVGYVFSLLTKEEKSQTETSSLTTSSSHLIDCIDLF